MGVVAIGFFLIILAAILILNRQRTPTDGNMNASSVLEAETKFVDGKSIDSAELSKKMLNNQNLVIIDIRSRPEFDKEHIRKSKNMLINDLTGLPKDKEYVIVFGDSSTAELSSLGTKLEDNGINNFSYLKGGFLSWKSGYNATVSEGDPNSFLDQAKVKYISSDELNKAMRTEKNIYPIDLRSNGQFVEGHIKGSANIPLSNLENEESKIPSGKKIILYDVDGLGAFKGSVRLYDLGFFNVLCLSDGFGAWKNKGFEIVK